VCNHRSKLVNLVRCGIGVAPDIIKIVGGAGEGGHMGGEKVHCGKSESRSGCFIYKAGRKPVSSKVRADRHLGKAGVVP
jgi:hypothetical protein